MNLPQESPVARTFSNSYTPPTSFTASSSIGQAGHSAGDSNASSSLQPAGVRRRRGAEILATAKAGIENVQQLKPTDWLDHVLTKTPTVGCLAALITFLGAIEPMNYHITPTENDPSNPTWREINSVSLGYSPSPMLCWLLCIATWHYDTYYAKHDNTVVLWGLYDFGRTLTMFGYGAYAIYDQLSRGWNGDWSPDQAAARYVQDKFFESIALAFALRQWRDFQYAKYTAPRNEASTAAGLGNFFYTPALLMAACWGWGRFLERNRPAYYIPRDSPKYPIAWQARVPRYLKAVTLPVGIVYGMLTSSGNLRQRFDNGFGKGMYMAMLLLHSGAFGTYGTLRLTDTSLLRWEQLLPLCTVVVVTAWQYRNDLFGLPNAIWTRVKNIFGNYHSDRDPQMLPSSSQAGELLIELDPMLPPPMPASSAHCFMSQDNAHATTPYQHSAYSDQGAIASSFQRS